MLLLIFNKDLGVCTYLTCCCYEYAIFYLHGQLLIGHVLKAGNANEYFALLQVSCHDTC